MEHLGTQRIETERLILRPLVVNDAQEMYENWASSEVATRYVTWKPYTEIETLIKHLKLREIEYQSNKLYEWGIVVKENNCLIGTIVFIGMSDLHKTVELAYVIGPNWWRNGYVVEAAQALFDFAFNQLHLHRIYAEYDVNNPASGRVMEKLGMQYEGTHRDRYFIKGKYMTVKQYAILASDFREI